jgi:hypothetical protein
MRVALASGLSAVVLFFFGFVWWGMLMPVLQPADVITDSTLVDKMNASLNESGLYFYPTYVEPVDANAGPMATLYFNTSAPSMPMMMGMGFVHMLVSALLASIGLSFVSRRAFMERFALVFFLGLFVAVWADLGNMIWWRYPLAWTAFHFAYDVLSWLLAGLIIASIVRPDSEPAESIEAA